MIDRSVPKNAGQHILGALEGLVTGEGIGADRDGAAKAIESLVQEMAMSPRFDVGAAERCRYVDSNLFDSLLDWKLAKRICRDAKADALVSLEAFDSDSFLDVVSEQKKDDDDRTYLEYEATRTTDVLTAWRIYDPNRKVLLDDVRDNHTVLSWEETARSRDAAVDRLPSIYVTVSDTGTQAGSVYGTRIAPHYVLRTRPYYASKDDRFKEARGYVQTREWDKAATLWRQVRDEGDPLLSAMAKHNLALFHEVNGRLEKARNLAQQAASSGGRGPMKTYYRELEYRVMQQQRLNEQMKAVEGN